MDLTKLVNIVHTHPSEIENGYPSPLKSEDFVHINVSGMKYITLRDTLEEFPGTLLGNKERRRAYYVDCLDAYFFDRHRECFESVLHYYQSGGTLFRPTHIPMGVFVQEARFFGISEEVLQHLYRMEGYVQTVEEEKKNKVVPKNDLQKKIWLLMDSPDSSLPARIIGCISILVILVSISMFCLETIPDFHNTLYVGQHSPNPTNISRTATVTSSNYQQVLQTINFVEIISVTWFTTEYLLRFTSSPCKWRFFVSFLNLIDLIAILPFFIVTLVEQQSGSSLAVVRIARLARVFRIFKLSRHSMGLQILGSTLKASLNELCMMLCVICFSVILFSSAIYYAEHKTSDSTMFKSIPHAFWYTLVTMTTVGYGDNVPVTIAGKVIGGFCAISGVLTVAMVIPIIVTNFEFFYKRDRINLAHQEQKLMSEKHAVKKKRRSTIKDTENDLLNSNA